MVKISSVFATGEGESLSDVRRLSLPRRRANHHLLRRLRLWLRHSWPHRPTNGCFLSRGRPPSILHSEALR
jgi:hypothetical protein